MAHSTWGTLNLFVYCRLMEDGVSSLLIADTNQFSLNDACESDQDKEVDIPQSYWYAAGRTCWTDSIVV